MCFKTPKLPPRRVPPDPEAAAKSNIKRVADNRRAAATGVFGNIFSSPTGDADYNSNVTSKATVGR